MIQWRGIDADPADFAVARRRAVNVPDAFGHEFGVVVRMLAEDQNQALVTLVFQGQNLRANFIFVQRAANHFAVRAPKCAVLAVVIALVADVKRGKDHNPVAVHVALELPGGVENLFDQFRLLGGQKHGRFLDRQRLLGHALGNDVANLARVRMAVQQALQAPVVDKVATALAEFRPIDDIRHSELTAQDLILKTLYTCLAYPPV